MNAPSALAGLIGQYGSGDSSGGEDNDEEVLKASESPAASEQLGVWSMCVDPATGCPYYWEQVTNQVCWEPPPGFLPISAAAPAKVNQRHNIPAITKSVQQAKLPEARATAKKPINKSKPFRPTSPSSDEEDKIELITSYYNSDSGSDEENHQEAKAKSVVRVYPRNAGQKRKPLPSNLSYDESSNSKKTKKILPGVTLIYGPELPQNVPDRAVYGPSLPLMADQVVDHGHHLPDVVIEPEIKKPIDIIANEIKVTNITCALEVANFPEEVASRVSSALEKGAIVIDTGKLESLLSNSCTPAEKEVVPPTGNGIDSKVIADSNVDILVKNKTTLRAENTEEIDNKSSSDIETENLDETVMDKLMVTQAKLLKKLGELVPSEIKYLVGSPKSGSVVNSTTQSPRGSSPIGTDSPAAKNSAALDMDVDDLIAQIEMEQPIDQPSTVSDSVSVGTVCSQDESTTKSMMVTDDTSESKPEVVFKPLFPSAVGIDSTENNEDIKNNDIINETHDIIQESVSVTDVNEKLELPEVIKNGEVIDIKVFNKYEMNAEELGIENAAFKRKRRIAIDVLPIKKTAVNNEPQSSNLAESYSKRDLNYTTKYSENFEVSGGRMGLGFKRDFSEDNFDQEPEWKKSNSYSNFKLGSILFKKGESLVPEAEKLNAANEGDTAKESDDIEKQKALIEAKLKFLTQSLPPVTPMQQLSIELQTLWGAWGCGALEAWRLRDWLDTAGTALARLETKAAPPPWTCRFHSAAGCYVYEHAVTGQQQFDYPEEAQTLQPPVEHVESQAGVTDMDICLTPPPQPPPWSPPPSSAPVNAEQKPVVRSLKFDLEPLPPGTELFPPPPSSTAAVPQHPPLPKEPPPPPPPPSVSSPTSVAPSTASTTTVAAAVSLPQPDANDLPSDQPPMTAVENPNSANDSLGDALNSFYSDLAALDEVVPEVPIVAPVLQKPPSPPPALQISVSSVKQDKKKKSKIKASSSLKNRSVSSLVEKWKKVQETFDKD